jgi:hypothetical protein
MDRRSSIKALLLISAGAASLPACLHEENKILPSFRNLKIDSSDRDLLSDVSETIIPTTNTPGAKDIDAPLFALMMIDDCYAPLDQDKFIKGLKGFNDFSKNQIDHSFVKCTPSQKQEILQSIETKKDVPADVAYFYSVAKKLTVEAFTSSKYYLTKVRVYQLVPGKFYGCVPVKKAS